jgi:hypothetical protein
MMPERNEMVPMSAFIATLVLVPHWLLFLLSPFVLAPLSVWAVYLFYWCLGQSFRPARIALTYLFCVATEHLCLGLMGFTLFNVLSAFAQITLSPQPFAALNLIHSYLANPDQPFRNYQYSNDPQTPDQWVWSSITLTIVGAIGIAGAIAIAKRRSIGYLIWLLLSAFFLFASIANAVLLFTVGPLSGREYFWTLVPIVWSISYAAAYWKVQVHRD